MKIIISTEDQLLYKEVKSLFYLQVKATFHLVKW